MRRPVFLLCLLMVTSDPLLRHWEAASDLAVSLAESRRGAARNEVEPVDDEAVDEPGVALAEAAADVPLADLPALADALPAALTPLAFLPPPPASRGPADRVFRPPAGSGLRYALLQRFLF